MAWVSVHESVYGSKLMPLYQTLDCGEWEATGILISLWTWGLNVARKDGLLKNVRREEITRYLYMKGIGSKLNPFLVVDALIATGWIDETDHGYYLHDWSYWQREWYKALERRENDIKRKQGKKKEDGPLYDTPEEREDELPDTAPATEEEPKQDQETPPRKTEPSQAKYSRDFEVFWEAYPRHIGKGEAYKKYKARLNDGFSPAELLTAAKNYAMQCKRKSTEQEYIKHAKTFLSENTPFIDFLPKEMAEQRQKTQEPGENPFARYMEGAGG